MYNFWLNCFPFFLSCPFDKPFTVHGSLSSFAFPTGRLCCLHFYGQTWKKLFIRCRLVFELAIYSELMKGCSWSALSCSETWLSWIVLIQLRFHRLRSIYALAHIVEEVRLFDDNTFITPILLQRLSNQKVLILLYFARTLAALECERIVRVF
jgi:hypothetical protein